MKHSNPREREFTPTGLMTYLECPRKFYFQKCMNVVPTVEANSKLFGTALHEAIGTYYLLQDQPLVTRTAKALAAFAKSWDESKRDDKRSLDMGLLIVGEYCKTYKNDTVKYLPQFIETPVTISMPNGTTLIMRIDRIWCKDDFYVVVDSKSTSMVLSDWFWKDYEMSFQLTGYHYAVEKLVGHCDNIQVDAVRINIKPEFVRRSFTKNELELAEWLNTYETVTRKILDSFVSLHLYSETTRVELELKNFYQNPCSCSKYGGCSFLKICKYGLSHPDIQIMFTRKEID